LDGISAQLQGDSLAAAIEAYLSVSYLRAIRNIDLLFESLEKNNTTTMDHHHIFELLIVQTAGGHIIIFNNGVTDESQQ
jgi:hypothetical protein